jgi:thiamine-monophosphate kinase
MSRLLSLGELGEYGLLERIEKKTATKTDPSILVDLGDDAFVAKCAKDECLVVTTDLSVENVHFRRDWAEPEQIGFKAMASNLSDLAAMGAVLPRYAFVGLALPEGLSLKFIDKLYTGMNILCKKHDLKIVGGDTVSSIKDIVISITLIGKAAKEHIIRRCCAKIGDIILATGAFGDSAAGLKCLEKPLNIGLKDRKFLINKHLAPLPRNREAGLLARSGKLTSLIDSSDGLAASVHFITQKSGVGARINIENVPVSNALKALARSNPGIGLTDLVLFGGEEYELVFTAKKNDVAGLKKLVPGLSELGEITAGKEIKYYLNGKPKNIKTNFYQHFKK